MFDEYLRDEMLATTTWPWFGSQDANADPDALGMEMFGPGIWLRWLNNFQGDPIGFEQVSVGAAAGTFAALPDMARSATITTESAGVRVRLDGKAPTTGVGLLFPPSTVFNVTGRKSLKGFQVIQSTGATSIDVAYFD